MITLIQRVNWAQVRIKDTVCAEIGTGLLAFIGIEKPDTQANADGLLQKILSYRVFSDLDSKMNLSIRDVEGGLLLVSQFTLAASTEKGLLPSFSSAKPPVEAEKLYDYLVKQAINKYDLVSSGQFAADMLVTLENDGPVTFILRA